MDADGPAHAAVFSAPVCGAALVYAPLHGVVAVVSAAARGRLARALECGGPEPGGELGRMVRRLREPAEPPHGPEGPLGYPLLLGLVPTRGCGLACGYCDFATSGRGEVMPDRLAAAAVDGYLNLLHDSNAGQGQIHFFGGEPFRPTGVVESVVGYARQRAARTGIRLHIEAITNGMVVERRARWIAQHLDTVILSLDGPPAIQDVQRPTRSGGRSSLTVLRTASLLAEGRTTLMVRSCVTDRTVDGLPQWAAWLSENLHPDTVCFEPLTPTAASLTSGQRPPDPYRFAVKVSRAADVLARHGSRTVHAMSQASRPRNTLCPVGQDALIVLPDGRVAACYLPPDRWRDHDLDLVIGRVDVAEGRLDLDPHAVDAVRAFIQRDRPQCAGCLCRYHCAGGCHVQHPTGGPPGHYDDQCVEARLLSVHRLLRELHLPELADRCLSEAPAAEALARNPDDRLLALDGTAG